MAWYDIVFDKVKLFAVDMEIEYVISTYAVWNDAEVFVKFKKQVALGVIA